MVPTLPTPAAYSQLHPTQRTRHTAREHHPFSNPAPTSPPTTRLLLLKPGGRTIYFGPLGPQQSTLIAYLEGVEGVPRYEPLMNPANYMLEVTAPAAEKQLGVDFGELWAASKEAQ